MSESIAIPFVCSLAALITADEAAAAAPKELYGKSVVVSWFESRSQNQRRGSLQNTKISIYMSTAGRTFTRVFVGGWEGPVGIFKVWAWLERERRTGAWRRASTGRSEGQRHGVRRSFLDHDQRI
jgi:hypothetical protein